tara:strand:+ start:122 stop:565 length:444 start_codon:yes stop_codon:yes gene_type:complete
MSDRSFAVVGDNNLITQVLIFNVDSEAEGITETRNFLNDQNATVVETFFDADQTSATRYNYGSIGFKWDSSNNAFYFPNSPYSSWSLNNSSFEWEAPTPFPSTGNVGAEVLDVFWNEPNLRWEGITAANPDSASYYWDPNTNTWVAI